MKTNKRTAKQKRFEKNRLEKIERNKRKRVTAKRKMKIMMQEEEQSK